MKNLLRSGALLGLVVVGFLFFQNCAAGFQPMSNGETSTSLNSGGGTTTATTGPGSSSGGGPPGPVASATPGPTVTLNWAAPTAGQQTGYAIQQSTDDTHFTTVMQVAGTQTSATVNVPAAGTTYYFRIQATNSGGGSAFTPVVTAVVPASQ